MQVRHGYAGSELQRSNKHSGTSSSINSSLGQDALRKARENSDGMEDKTRRKSVFLNYREDEEPTIA